jgi:hypothetical protein
LTAPDLPEYDPLAVVTLTRDWWVPELTEHLVKLDADGVLVRVWADGQLPVVWIQVGRDNAALMMSASEARNLAAALLTVAGEIQ